MRRKIDEHVPGEIPALDRIVAAVGPLTNQVAPDGTTDDESATRRRRRRG
jgi:hypothetical protein